MEHVGVIMDGNRRWARKHALEVFQGHNKGAEVFGHLCDWCLQAKIPYLTVFAFSTENWQRTESEIKHLMGLMEKYFVEERERCLEKGVKIQVIGNRELLNAKARQIVSDIEGATAFCRNLHVNIALSYGGRDEIVRATKKILRLYELGEIDEITEDYFESFLDTALCPEVDLVIRTGGSENRRTSNFLIWQAAYAELFFSDLLWPDFSQDEFNAALKFYNESKRNKGK